MGEDNTIELFMNKVQYLVNTIHSHGEQLGDTKIFEKVLRSLPQKFTTAIEDSRNLTQLTLLKLQVNPTNI